MKQTSISSILLGLLAISFSAGLSLKIQVEITQAGFSLESSLGKQKFVQKIDFSTLKQMLFVYQDCKLKQIKDKKSLDRCTKDAVFPLDQSAGGNSGISIEVSLDFQELDRSAFELLRITLIDFSRGEAVFYVRPRQSFALIGYSFDFKARTYALLLDELRFPVSELEALELLNSGLENKAVKMASLLKSEAKLVDSGWKVAGTTTGFFVVFHKASRIADFRVYKSSNSSWLVFELWTRELGFYEYDFFESRYKAHFQIRDRTPFVKELKCELKRKLEFVSAGKPLDKEEDFPTLFAREVVLGKNGGFNDAIFDSALAQRKNPRDARPNYRLSLNTIEKDVHFELDREPRLAWPISFKIKAEQNLFTLDFLTREKISGEVRKVSFELERKEAIEIQFHFFDAKNTEFISLKLKRGVIVDLPVFKEKEICEFLDSPSLIKNHWINSENEEDGDFAIRGSDFGWFEDISAETFELQNLEILPIFKQGGKILALHIFDISKALAARISINEGASIFYRLPGNAFEEREELMVADNKQGDLTEANIESIEFKALSWASDSPLEDLEVVSLVFGKLYFVKISESLGKILEKKFPAIECLQTSDDKISYVIYSGEEILRTQPIGTSEIAVNYSGSQKTLRTQNKASMKSISLVFSSDETNCHQPEFLAIGKTEEKPKGRALLFNAKDKQIKSESINSLPSINPKKNFIIALGKNKDSLTLKEREDLSFSGGEDICGPGIEGAIKFTLTFDTLTIQDPLSEKTLESPIREFDGFALTRKVAFQNQKPELLFCEDEFWDFEEENLLFDSQSKRGIIFDSNGRLRELFFGNHFEKYNKFYQIAFSAKQAEKEDVLKISYNFEPGTIEVEIAKDDFYIRAPKKTVHKKIDAVDNFTQKFPEEYTANKILMFFNELVGIQGKRKAVEKETSLFSEIKANKLLSFFGKNEQTPAFSYSVSANVFPGFIESDLEVLSSLSLQIMVANIETSVDELTTVLYNGSYFELLELKGQAVYRWGTNVRESSGLIRLDSLGKKKDRGSVFGSVVNSSMLSESGLSFSGSASARNRLEKDKAAIKGKVDLSANYICAEDECVRMRVFSTQEKDRAFVLVNKSGYEALLSIGSELSLQKEEEMGVFVGKVINVKKESDLLV